MKRIEQMALGNVPAQVPIAVYQGEDVSHDFLPAATEAYVKRPALPGLPFRTVITQILTTCGYREGPS